MGSLINGKWNEGTIVTSDKKGGYDRQPRTFRDNISQEHPYFHPESNRYHLYVSYACPWATRTLIYRKLKELDKHITVSVVHPDMLNDGWTFEESYPGATKDHLFGFKFLREVYQKADDKITTSVTVPVLWDKKTNAIVNNESSEIIRIFNTAFDHLTGNKTDYYPENKRAIIDELNDDVYQNINNGVYRVGFARTQEAYDDSLTNLFASLERIESILADNRYLTGDTLSEADLRLIPTLLRFDIVYVTHFKCNLKQLKDFKNLRRYTKELYDLPAIKDSTNFDHIKRHYYYSHNHINPYRIIPKGPEVIL